MQKHTCRKLKKQRKCENEQKKNGMTKKSELKKHNKNTYKSFKYGKR